MSLLRLAGALAVAALMAGCATPKASVNQDVGKDPEKPLPHRILVIEPDIQVHEVSAGGVVEKVDDWSKEATGHALKSLENAVQSRHLFDAVQSPDLSADDKSLLEQYTGLYALVSGSAYGATHSPYSAWRDRAAQFDYTLGPGLKPFCERNKIDAAIFLVGTDYISSAGRKAAMAFGILAAAFTGIVIVPTSQPAFMSAGVVDLKTGDLLWYSTDIRSGSANLRDPAVMQSLIDDLFDTYPGAAKAADAAPKK